MPSMVTEPSVPSKLTVAFSFVSGDNRLKSLSVRVAVVPLKPLLDSRTKVIDSPGSNRAEYLPLALAVSPAMVKLL